MPRAHFLGDGFLRVPAGRPAVITVDPRKSSMAGDTVVEIHAPSNRVLRAHVTPITGKALFKAEFVPREIGELKNLHYVYLFLEYCKSDNDNDILCWRF
jgi:hypothetical protein